MEKFKVWEKGQESIEVEAGGMNEALDIAAHKFGFIDYADMAQERAWSESEGLNIERA